MKVPGEYQAVQPQAATANRAQKRPTSSKYPIRAEVISSVGETLFTVPDGEFWRIDKMSIYNDHTSGDSVDFHLIDAGDTAGAGNRVGIESVGSKDTVSLEYLTGVVMGPGQFFYVDPDTSLCVMFGGVTRFFQGEFSD